MDSAEQSLKVLRRRCKDIADEWHQAIAQTHYVPPHAAQARQHLLELAERAVTLLLTEPFNEQGARAIGASLARFYHTQPQVLGITLQILATQLVQGLTAEQTVELGPRLAELLGGVAIGFTQHSAAIFLAEQDRIRNTLTSSLQQAEAALQTTHDQAEQQFRERTTELTAANEQLVQEITERKRAEEELARRARELATLYETSLQINAQPNLPALLRTIVDRALGLLGVPTGGLYLTKPDGETLELAISYNLPSKYVGATLRLGEGVAGHVAQTKTYLLVENYQAWDGRAAMYAGLLIGRTLGVPLKVRDRVIGVITVSDTRLGSFSENEIQLVSLFADQAAIAIERAQLYETAQRELAERQQAEEALKRRTRELDLINRMGQTLTETLNLEEVTDRLMLVIAEIIGAEGDSIWVWDEERAGGLVCMAASHPGLKRPVVNMRLGAGEGIVGSVAQNGRSIIVSRASDTPDFSPAIDAQTGFHTTSVIAVPLRVRDRVVGVLEVVNKLNGEFNAEDCALLETLAPSAAIAIENARLVETLHQQAAELWARNEELDAFAHTVAHDLRNPLGPVVTIAEILENEYTTLPDEELRRYLHMVGQSGRKMSNIIDELLLFSTVRKAEVATQPLDMAGIVQEALSRLADPIKDSYAEVLVPDRWPAAMGAGPWVEEVWVNYLSNAIRHGGQPPHVELGAETLPEGMVRFWVRDNGPGIAPEEQARLFTPFTRLRQVHAKGHGLGLSIVKRIVEKLGGQVAVESSGTPGQGSVFSFTLPAPPTTGPAQAARESSLLLEPDPA